MNANFPVIHVTYNDRTILPPNFKAVSQTQTELHIFKVGKLNNYYVYKTPFHKINPATYIGHIKPMIPEGQVHVT